MANEMQEKLKCSFVFIKSDETRNETLVFVIKSQICRDDYREQVEKTDCL